MDLWQVGRARGEGRSFVAGLATIRPRDEEPNSLRLGRETRKNSRPVHARVDGMRTGVFFNGGWSRNSGGKAIRKSFQARDLWLSLG